MPEDFALFQIQEGVKDLHCVKYIINNCSCKLLDIPSAFATKGCVMLSGKEQEKDSCAESYRRFERVGAPERAGFFLQFVHVVEDEDRDFSTDGHVHQKPWDPAQGVHCAGAWILLLLLLLLQSAPSLRATMDKLRGNQPSMKRKKSDQKATTFSWTDSERRRGKKNKQPIRKQIIT